MKPLPFIPNVKKLEMKRESMDPGCHSNRMYHPETQGEGAPSSRLRDLPRAPDMDISQLSRGFLDARSAGLGHLHLSCIGESGCGYALFHVAGPKASLHLFLLAERKEALVENQRHSSSHP